MASRSASDAKFEDHPGPLQQDPETTIADLPREIAGEVDRAMTQAARGGKLEAMKLLKGWGANNTDDLQTLLKNGWSESFDSVGDCTKCDGLLSSHSCSAWKRGEKEGYCAKCALQEPKMDSK